jgi:parallel beta-helix repeat protein
MNKKALKSLIPALLLLTFTIIVLNGTSTRFVNANFFPPSPPSPAVTIRPDGSITPSSAPIQRLGQTYTLKADIDGVTLVIQRSNIVVDGAGYTLRGNNNTAGVFLQDQRNVLIKNLTITNYVYGVWFTWGLSADQGARDNTIANCTLTNNKYGVLAAMFTQGNTLDGNTIKNGEYGVYISASQNNTLTKNRLYNNTYNLWVDAETSGAPEGFTNNIDASNTVEGKPVIYWTNQKDRAVPSDAGYVALINCTRITVQNLNLRKNGQGVLLVATKDSAITNNTIENNYRGVMLTGTYASCSGNRITANIVINNTKTGVMLQGVDNNIVSHNRIERNRETGIDLFEAVENVLEGNNITANMENGVKLWFSAAQNVIRGNYITNNGKGILIADSFDNQIIANTIVENNGWALRFEGSQNNNLIYLNTIVNNRVAEGLQVSIPGAWGSIGTQHKGGNVWDNGTVGNYWGDYKTRYPNASEIANTGTGDTPYFINENNIDRRPLLRPTNAVISTEATPLQTIHDWTTLQHDEKRTGCTQSPPPEDNRTSWKLQTGGPINSGIAVAQGLAFATSADGYLYAVNVTTGKEAWRFWTGPESNSPSVANGKVFITVKSGAVHAVDAKTGKLVWNRTLDEEACPGAPLVLGSRVFINGKTKVYALNDATGVLLYIQPMARGQSIGPLVYNEGLIVAPVLSGEVGVNGFEANNGYARFWMTLSPTPADNIRNCPAAYNASLFILVSTPEGSTSVHALNTMNLPQWTKTVDGVTEASPAIANDVLYVATQKAVYALDAASGTTRWNRTLDSKQPIKASLTVANGKLHLAVGDTLYALDADNGQPLWTYKAQGLIQSSPAITNGLIIFGASDGNLYAVGYLQTQTFHAGTWNNTDYYVQVNSNSTITNFHFNPVMKQIAFQASGPTGTIGQCNITIPIALLNDKYTVTHNGKTLTYRQESNQTHNILYFSYIHESNAQIAVKGTKAIPELNTPSTIALLVGVTAFLAATTRITNRKVHV